LVNDLKHSSSGIIGWYHFYYSKQYPAVALTQSLAILMKKKKSGYQVQRFLMEMLWCRFMQNIFIFI
jgi:hypothetical protein